MYIFFTETPVHSWLPHEDSFCCTLPFMLQFILHISVLRKMLHFPHVNLWLSCHYTVSAGQVPYRYVSHPIYVLHIK